MEHLNKIQIVFWLIALIIIMEYNQPSAEFFIMLYLIAILINLIVFIAINMENSGTKQGYMPTAN